jgi:hypothetical protein
MTDIAIIPDLIQRARFMDRPHKEGLDSILQYDYMGSSEFEFGALGKSLKEGIRPNLSSYVYGQIAFEEQKFSVTYFCPEILEEDVKVIIPSLGRRDYRLKERCDFSKYYSGESISKWDNQFWWDIEHHWMFWITNQEFETKFQQLIAG